jgi:phosphoribosylformimino-5-aminoimidazole carboxamide ribotide isomerase
MIVIPAIDIYEDKVVRLLKGNFNQIKIYNESPLEQARQFAGAGFKRIHIVDLSGSREGKVKIVNWIEQIKKETDLIIECGGGIRTRESAHDLLSAGVDYLIIGSVSITDSGAYKKILLEAGVDRIIIASDVHDRMVAIKGWEETSSVSLDEHIKENSGLGISQFLCTDIAKDGMLTGTNHDLYQYLQETYPSLKFIASGGVKDASDLDTLKQKNMYAAIVGKALYERRITFAEMMQYDG